MKISIIIPVFNASLHLNSCLDSVLAQTFCDWEAICIDDGSSDGSELILDEYARKDQRFRVIHQKNTGVWGARNTALEMVRGEWITFVDSDDQLAPRWLEEAMRIAEVETPDLIRQAYFFGLRPPSDFGEQRPIGEMRVYSGRDAAKWAWRLFPPWGFLWLCFIRREVINGLRFRPVINCKEDGIFLVELIPRLNKICTSSFEGYFYRRVETSLTKKKRRVCQCVAFMNAYEDIWVQQKTWAKTLGIEKIVQQEILRAVNNDLVEWSRMQIAHDPTGSSKDILLAYRSLRSIGGISASYYVGQFRYWLPLLLWRLTGWTIGFRVIECLLTAFRKFTNG